MASDAASHDEYLAAYWAAKDEWLQIPHDLLVDPDGAVAVLAFLGITFRYGHWCATDGSKRVRCGC